MLRSLGNPKTIIAIAGADIFLLMGYAIVMHGNRGVRVLVSLIVVAILVKNLSVNMRVLDSDSNQLEQETAEPEVADAKVGHD